jgi:tyrosine-specific transport protein
MLEKERKNFWPAVAVMVGYIIGVGMFGLPFLIVRAGALTFFIFLLFLGPIQYLLHLIYANLIVATETYHRLPGYAGIYLGPLGRRLVFAAKLIGNYGAMLAYIIITGIFFSQLFSPYFGGSEFFYASLLFIFEATVVFFGIGMLAQVEFLMTLFLLLIVFLIVVRGWPFMSLANIPLVDWHYFFLPYGAILFSLDGSGSLPIVVKLLRRDKKAIKKVVRIGTFLPILVSIIFTLSIVAITGTATTEDALTGVNRVLGDGVVLLALVFGILTMVTSFLGVAESLKETLWWDFKFNKRLAWFLAVFVPYGLYIAGFKNFINVINFVGALAGGFCAIIMILIFQRLRQADKLPLFKRKPPVWLIYFLIALFAGGIIYVFI